MSRAASSMLAQANANGEVFLRLITILTPVNLNVFFKFFLMYLIYDVGISFG